MLEAKPENLIGDRAYDSDALDVSLKKQSRRDDRTASFGEFGRITDPV